MNLRSIDPYCNYLFQDTIGKDLMLSKLDADIEYDYSHQTRYNLEKFKSGEALLKIAKTIASNKKLVNIISKDGKIAEFHKLNRELIEYNIQKQAFDGDQTYTIIVNLMNTINKIEENKVKEKTNSDSSVHLDVPCITKQIRKLFGFYNLSLANLRKMYLFKRILLSIFQVIVICMTLLIGIDLNTRFLNINNGSQFSFLIPILNNIEEVFTSLSISLGIENINTVSIISFCIAVILSILSIIAGFVLQKRRQLEYEVHYFARIIGVSAVKLREIGWL